MRILTALLVILAQVLTLDGFARTRTPAQILADNAASVVFIEVSGTDRNGVPRKTIGTGIIVSNVGHVLTARHLLQPLDEKGEAMFDGPPEVSGAIGSNANPQDLRKLDRRSVDQDADLALFQFRGIQNDYRSVTTLCVGVARVSDGDDLVSIGFPRGSDRTIVTGILSGRHNSGLLQTTLPLSYGFSGGPVFSDGGRLIGIVAGGTPGVEGRNFFTPLHEATNLLARLPDRPTDCLSIRSEKEMPPALMLATRVNCQIAEAGFLPIQGRGSPLVALPSDIGSGGSGTKRYRIEIDRLGKVVQGFDNLRATAVAAASATVGDIPCLQDQILTSPTFEPSSVPVPLIVTPSEGTWNLEDGIALEPGQVLLPNGSSIDMASMGSARVKVSNVARVDLDMSNLEFLRSLLQTTERAEAVFLVSKMLVSRVDLSATGVSQRRFNETSTVPAAILGLDVIRIVGGRWNADNRNDSRDGRVLRFLDEYQSLTNQVFDPADPSKRIFKCEFRDGRIDVEFYSPLRPTGYGIFVEGEAPEVGISSISLPNRRNKLDFLAVSSERFFAVHLETTGDPSKPCLDERSFAELITWRSFNFQTYQKDREAAETELAVERLSGLAERVIDASLGGQRQPGSPAGMAPSGRNLRAKLNPDDLAELTKRRARAEERPDLTLAQRQSVELARNVEAWGRTGDPIDLDQIQDQWTILAQRAEFAIFTHAARKLDEERWLAAAADLGRAMDFTPDASRRSRYCHLRIAALYQDWQTIGRRERALPANDPGRSELIEQQRSRFERIVPALSRCQEAASVLPIEDRAADFPRIFGWTGAQPSELDPPAPWTRTVYFAGNNRTTFGGNTASLRTASSSFALVQRINLDVAKLPFLAFDWAAYELPLGGDLRIDSADDQAIQVLVLFMDTNGNFQALNYVWDTTAPVNTKHRRSLGLGSAGVFPVSYIVVHQGATERGQEWRAVRRAFLDDVRDAFGESTIPYRIMGLAVQANSQWTRTSSNASIGPILFSSQPLPIDQNLRSLGGDTGSR